MVAEERLLEDHVVLDERACDRETQALLSRLEKHEALFERFDARLDSVENRITKLETEMRFVLWGVYGILAAAIGIIVRFGLKGVL